MFLIIIFMHVKDPTLFIWYPKMFKLHCYCHIVHQTEVVKYEENPKLMVAVLIDNWYSVFSSIGVSYRATSLYRKREFSSPKSPAAYIISRLKGKHLSLLALTNSC